MSAPNPHIKVKLIVSYVIFLAMLLVVLFFIYDKVRIYTTVEQSSELQTDSIARLIAEKDQRMLDLVQSIGELNSNFIGTNQELERYLVDSFDAPVIEKKTVVISDTIVSKDTNKRFIERLADAFSPNNADNTVEVKTRVETQVDTVYDSAINKEAFKKLQAKLRKERIALQVRQTKTEELKQLNEEMTNRIDSLLTNYEQKQINNILTQVEQENINRKRAFLWIGSIAIASIILIIVFSSLLLKDINSNNRYRKALERANKRSEDLLRAREKLMLTITHDIKAPTGTIMGYSELLRQTPLSDSQLEYLQSIDIASEHISKLVHDLLDYHLLDLNKLELQEDNFNLKTFIDEILGSFTPQYQKKRLGLSTNYKESEIDKWVRLDALRLKQILNNLLSNALKFTDQGNVELSVILDQERVIFKVKDTGRGMAPEDKERVFKEFTRLPSAQGKEGFGLGLSIVSKIVHAMGGIITVNSILDKGTTFTVILPYEMGESTLSQSNIHKKTISQKNLLAGVSILLMDDDLLQLKMMKAILEGASAAVTTCHSLNTLLSLLDNHQFDVLITDVQMPEITGFDLVFLLKNSNKKEYRSIPIIIASAREKLEEGLSSGKSDIIGILNKPFNANDVWKILNNRNKDSFLDKQDEAPSVTTYTPHISSLDPLFAFVEGDVDAQVEILESFSNEFSKGLIDLQRAIEEDDYNQVPEIAHRMLPVMKMLHRDDICDVLIELEQRNVSLSKKECDDKIGFLQKEISNLVDVSNKMVVRLRNSSKQ